MGEGETIADYQFPSYINTVNHCQHLEWLKVAKHSLENDVQALWVKQRECFSSSWNTWDEFYFHISGIPLGLVELFQSATTAAMAAASLAVPAERYGEHGNDYWWCCFPAAASTEPIILSFSLPIQTTLAKYKTDSTINMDSIRDSGEKLLAESIILQ